MEVTELESIIELSHKEVLSTNGGGFIAGLLGAATFHVIKEAYNDWDAHVEAFNEGRESMN